jgi:hypothetical protein
MAKKRGKTQITYVEVTRTISCTVEVPEATSPEDAVNQVSRGDFELPPRSEWAGHKDWTYRVYDEDGELAYEEAP